MADGYIGKTHIVTAIDQFHAAHPNVALQIDVTRHPYSFLGDSVSTTGRRDQISTWHDGLLGYVGGDPAARDRAEEGMRAQGRAAGIEFDFHVNTHWQPVDSQRLLLWAARFGKQEEFMSELNKRHFEGRTSASERPTLLAAAAAAGLDASAAAAFLSGRELEVEVWKSYGETIHAKGIRSIPLFVFNVPQLNLVGGPFRAGPGTPFVVNGSMDAPTFLRIFTAAHDRLAAAQKTHPLLGRKARLGGLQSKAELNGRRGLVRGFSDASGRYEFALDDDDDGTIAPLAIKPANLTLADPLPCPADGPQGSLDEDNPSDEATHEEEPTEEQQPSPCNAPADAPAAVRLPPQRPPEPRQQEVEYVLMY